jgi:hypothetical protein
MGASMKGENMLVLSWNREKNVRRGVFGQNKSQALDE